MREYQLWAGRFEEGVGAGDPKQMKSSEVSEPARYLRYDHSARERQGMARASKVGSSIDKVCGGWIIDAMQDEPTWVRNGTKGQPCAVDIS